MAQGVDEAQVSIINEEQAAIDAALRMGEPGDLVLIFADALVRSWKQVIKFQPEGETSAPPRFEVPVTAETADESTPTSLADYEDLVRDERGVRLAREEND